MNTTTYDESTGDWEEPYDGPPAQEEATMPTRPRRRFLVPWTAALIALVTAAAGFLGGIELEKGQTGSGTSSASGRFAALAARFGGSGGASGRAAGGTAAGGASGAAAGGAAGFAGLRGGGFGGGGGQAGTVSSVSGKTIDLTTTDGNTVKVTLSSATKVTKSLDVPRNRIHPGDTIVVAGVTKSNGTIVATSLTDSGASAASSSSSSSTSSSSSGSSGGVSSLFQSGGGG